MSSERDRPGLGGRRAPTLENVGDLIRPERRGTWTPVLVAATVAGVLLRLWVATLGYNYDLESFHIVGNLVAHGDNVYANTTRYNYGPVWFGVLGAVKWLQLQAGSDAIQVFHLALAALLATVDVTIGWLLARRFGTAVGVVFALSPVSILTTGYHSQFDNLAVLLALVSWSIIAGRQQSLNRVLISAAILGVSLSTKHLLIFFPLWVLLSPGMGGLAHRIAYAAVAYGVFILSFVPFALTEAALAGIRQHVVPYSSYPTHALLRPLVDLVVPVFSVERMFGWIPFFPGVKLVWLLAMLSAGWVVMRRFRESAVLFYLLALVGLSPAMAAQYLAIPLATLAVFWRSP